MKCRLSTDAVTTGQRACRSAAIAAARSTRCITFPPRTFPSPLASLGSAISEYSETDSRTGLPSKARLRLAAQITLRIRLRLAGEHARRGLANGPAGHRILQRAVRKGMVVALGYPRNCHQLAII